MEEDIRQVADRRFAEAISSTGARDPRDFYRQRLRELRELDHAGFSRALDYYDNRLIPAVAAEGSDPIGEWLEYGRLLAEIRSDGHAVQIDRSGRSRPYARPVPLESLVLHLPASAREPAVPIGLPPELSPAQRATFDLLVRQARLPEP